MLLNLVLKPFRHAERKTNIGQKILKREAKVGVLGIGYVGKEVAHQAAKVRFPTLGFDIDKEKIRQVKKNGNGIFAATDDFSHLSQCDVILVCVPTPVGEDKKPDLSHIKEAILQIRENLRENQLILIESTVAPKTTREIILPILEEGGAKLGEDFYLAYAPERIDLQNKKFNLQNTPKVVGANDQTSRELATLFYKTFTEKIIPVSSFEAAELTKMLENTFRLVNISLIHEIEKYANKMGVDIWEVIEATSTKPYAFMPHYPGPGVGGHCIPVDPYYLLESARENDLELKMLEEALRINEKRPFEVAKRALELTQNQTIRKNGQTNEPKILLVGLAYKKDITDTRESAAIKIWQILEGLGAKVSYHDPLVPQFFGQKSIKLTKESLSGQDLIIIVTDHSPIPYQKLLEAKIPILDTRNVFSNSPLPLIFKM